MIDVREATRDYGDLRAVDRVSCRVEAGEIVGFLGPNGAGKSTLLRMMSTYLPLSGGRIEIAGHDVERAPLLARASLGYLPEHNALYEGMRTSAFLRFVARARALRGAHLLERLDWVRARCALEEVWERRVGWCSKGYRQRIGLAAALVHDPPVLLLDEPTHGLDPLQVVAFRDFLHELSAGRAILFSSHVLAEVAQMSDRLLAVQRGRLVLDRPLEALRAEAAAEGTILEERVLRAFLAGALEGASAP